MPSLDNNDVYMDSVHSPKRNDSMPNLEDATPIGKRA